MKYRKVNKNTHSPGEYRKTVEIIDPPESSLKIPDLDNEIRKVADHLEKKHYVDGSDPDWEEVERQIRIECEKYEKSDAFSKWKSKVEEEAKRLGCDVNELIDTLSSRTIIVDGKAHKYKIIK